jgi:hypothetical protein
MFSALQRGHLMRIAAAMASGSMHNSSRPQAQQRTCSWAGVNLMFTGIVSLLALPGDGRLRP